MFVKLQLDNLDRILEILKQDTLRGYNGQYAETQKPWIQHFLTDDECFAIGKFIDDKLVAIILAEKLSYSGCILWYIATDPQFQNLGIGTELLKHFESYLKQKGIDWIFLNSSGKSLKFYSKNGYITSEWSNVWEHVKEF